MAINEHKTQVGIIGAGAAGLTLSLLLKKQGIDCVVLESRDRAYVESRIRAGLLEQNTVDLFRELGIAERMDRQGLQHQGVYLSFNGKRSRIPFYELTGRAITIYGQQEIVKDLIRFNLERGTSIQFEAVAIRIEGIDTISPAIHYDQNGSRHILKCEFVAGCDGYHGISRNSLPHAAYKEYRIEYPFNWLGVLADVAPSTDELIYAYHDRGFALHSLRSKKVSRFYLQVNKDENLDNCLMIKSGMNYLND